MVVIWRLYPTLLYRSYKRVVVVLYRLVRLGIACRLSPCYALIWRLYAVVWRVYGVLWRTMAVYIVGYAIMAYGIGVWLCVGIGVCGRLCVRCMCTVCIR